MVQLRWLAVFAFCALLALPGQAQIQGSPPDITFVDFPTTINLSNGPQVGRVYFKDLDKDVVQAEFSVVEASAFEAFILDLAGAVQSDGVFQFFEFLINPTVAQRVTLSVTLVDAQGLRSPPRQFSFSVVAQQTGAPNNITGAGALLAEPGGLRFEAPAGGQNPPTQSIDIGHTQATTFSWSAHTNVPWVRLGQTQGEGPATLAVAVGIAGLTVGVRLGQIIIESPDAANRQVVVNVILTVLSGGPSVSAPAQGVLLVISFLELAFATPDDWVFALESGCFIYTNVGRGASLLHLSPTHGGLTSYAVPAGNQIVVCGNTVQVDTRL